MARVALCKTDELPPQTILCKRIAGMGEVAVVRLAGSDEVVAFEPRCPHARGPLAEGKLHGSIIVCPWHFFPFDLRTGKAASGDSILALRRYPVTVEDGEVLVELE
jgi:nitrite reductase/ring-hydroxylating ferredoxin subunit